MAELKRKEELTTADLAGRNEEQNRRAREAREAEDPDRPKRVQSEVSVVRERANMDKAGISPAANTARPPAGNVSTPLFSESDIGDLRGRWGNVQAGFVDEPRRAVE